MMSNKKKKTQGVSHIVYMLEKGKDTVPIAVEPMGLLKVASEHVGYKVYQESEAIRLLATKKINVRQVNLITGGFFEC